MQIYYLGKFLFYYLNNFRNNSISNATSLGSLGSLINLENLQLYFQ